MRLFFLWSSLSASPQQERSLSHSDSIRFIKRSSIPRYSRGYDNNSPTPQLTLDLEWFFHLYQESFIVDIVFIYHQAQMAIFRKEVRNRGVQESTESNQVKKCDFNNNVNFPAPGNATIIRAPEIAFNIDNMGLVLKAAIQHGSALLFLNIQDRAR
jgi:hypothetical protein